MKKPKLIILFIILLLIIPTIINLANIDDDSESINFSDEKESNLTIDSKKPKTAAYQTYNELWIDDSSVCGNGSWADIALAYPSWCTWTGSEYILEDITLTNPDNTGSPLIIANSTVKFIIRNCTVSNSETSEPHAGIKLVNASNGKIYNCHISNNRDGIRLDGYAGDYSINNEIKNNTIDNDGRYGINVISNCDQNNIINNTITNSGLDGITISNSDDCVFENNTIDGCRNGADLSSGNNVIFRNNTISNTGAGASAIFCSNTDSLILSGNTMLECGICLAFSVPWRYQNTIIHLNNTVNGKPVYYYKNQNWLKTINFTYAGQPGQIMLYDCHYSTISNLNLSDASIGIHLSYSSHNNISSNFIKNGPTGIRLYYSNENNTIFNNTLRNQYSQGIYLMGYGSGYNADNNIVQNYISGTRYGIVLYYSNEHNNITHNKVKENDFGIHIYESDNNLVYNNTCNDNDDYGIYIRNGASDNQLIENNCTETSDGYDQNCGIYLETNCHNNTILNNTVINNGDYGIWLRNNCNESDIIGNLIKNNIKIGVYIDDVDGDNCGKNNITNNRFIGNGQHAQDDHSGPNPNNWDGNWWDNYTGCDSNGDGYGETPYLIPGDGNAKDNKPLTDNTCPPSTPPPAAGDDDDDDDDDDTGAMILVVAVIVIACVGAVILIFIILRKKE